MWGVSNKQRSQTNTMILFLRRLPELGLNPSISSHKERNWTSVGFLLMPAGAGKVPSASHLFVVVVLNLNFE